MAADIVYPLTRSLQTVTEAAPTFNLIPLAIAVAAGSLAYVVHAYIRKQRHRRNQEKLVSQKLDDLIAAVGGLDTRIGATEAAVATNSANIATAVGLFTSNAAAAVELAADDAKIGDLKTAVDGIGVRVDTLNAKLTADDAALAAAETAPAPAA